MVVVKNGEESIEEILFYFYFYLFLFFYFFIFLSLDDSEIRLFSSTWVSLFDIILYYF